MIDTSLEAINDSRSKVSDFSEQLLGENQRMLTQLIVLQPHLDRHRKEVEAFCKMLGIEIHRTQEFARRIQSDIDTRLMILRKYLEIRYFSGG